VGFVVIEEAGVAEPLAIGLLRCPAGFLRELHRSRSQLRQKYVLDLVIFQIATLRHHHQVEQLGLQLRSLHLMAGCKAS
jgi:hypothetical protein